MTFNPRAGHAGGKWNHETFRSVDHTAVTTYDFLTLMEKTWTLFKGVEVYYMVQTQQTALLMWMCLYSTQQCLHIWCRRVESALGQYYWGNLWPIKHLHITLSHMFFRGPLVSLGVTGVPGALLIRLKQFSQAPKDRTFGLLTH